MLPPVERVCHLELFQYNRMASTRRLKRILLSIVAGIVFPVAYLMFIGALEDFLLPKSELFEIEFYGKHLPGFLYVPMVIPVYVLEFLDYYNYFGLVVEMDNPLFRTVFMCLFTVLLYSRLAYELFRRRGWFGSK